jgi:hypothetical protein
MTIAVRGSFGISVSNYKVLWVFFFSPSYLDNQLTRTRNQPKVKVSLVFYYASTTKREDNLHNTFQGHIKWHRLTILLMDKFSNSCNVNFFSIAAVYCRPWS